MRFDIFVQVRFAGWGVLPPVDLDDQLICHLRSFFYPAVCDTCGQTMGPRQPALIMKAFATESQDRRRRYEQLRQIRVRLAEGCWREAPPPSFLCEVP